MSDWTGMGPNAPAPKLDPNCQCICHSQPGVMHVAACCSAPPMTAARDDLAAQRPSLIYARQRPNGALGVWHDATSSKETASIANEGGGTMNPFSEYVLATPAALSAHPAVRALVEALQRDVHSLVAAICDSWDERDRLAAELDDTQTQLGDWIVRADEANVRAEKAEAELAAAQQREAGQTFYIDCEFDGHGGPLLSIAMVREDGWGVHVSTGVVAEDPWVIANVLPWMNCHDAQNDRRARPRQVGAILRDFIGDCHRPTIIADSPVDIGRFCEAISTGEDGGWASTGYEVMTFEVHNVDCYPTKLKGAVQHNAWWDAMALRAALSHGGRGGDLPDAVDPPCTDCDDTGITHQTERFCSCGAGIAAAHNGRGE